MDEVSVERADIESPHSVHPGGLVITEEFIRQRFGMEIVVIFPTFETDASGIISHGEELERIGKLCGYDNVIASLYFEEGELLLGIFAKEGSIPRPIETSSSELQPMVAELG